MSTLLSNDDAANLEQRIAMRAYERWMQRGCPRSDGTEDWFAARAEIEQEHYRARVAHDLEVAIYQ